MGFEPTTPFGASDFESDRWPIRLPSEPTDRILIHRVFTGHACPFFVEKAAVLAQNVAPACSMTESLGLNSGVPLADTVRAKT